MDHDPDAVPFDLGLRIRAARHRRRLTQRAVEAATGVSSSTQSRMELGRGAPVPLRTWALVSEAVGADLFQPPPDPTTVYLEALRRMLARGAWSLTGRGDGYAWFDRPPRQDPRLPRLLLPAERVVVDIVTTVTDGSMHWRRLDATVRAIRRASPPGCIVGGVFVVIRSEANRRRLRASGGAVRSYLWLGALQRPTVTIPTHPGWVWMTPGGTHLLRAA